MKILNLIKDFVFGQKKVLTLGSYPAVADVIQKMLGKKLWLSIERNTPDRRQLIEVAASKKGISEEELIKQIAEKLGIAVFFRPKATDVDALPEGIMLPDLRIAGVLPIIAQDLVIGVVCVDPAALNFMPNLYVGSNVYLSSWQAILAALDESEQLYRQKKELQAQKMRERDEEIFKKVIGRLAEQALDAEAAMIYLLSDSDCLLFSFKDKTEHEWTGRIDPKIALKLARYLEDNIANDCNLIEAQSSKNHKILIELSVEHGRILLELSKKIISIEGENSVQIQPQESAKIMPFPRLIKNEDREFKPIFEVNSVVNLLLIDDNPTFASILQKFLKKQNVNAEIYHSADIALKFLKTKGTILPDLILSDLHMPGVNGLEFIRQIKQEALLSNIPVIALTSDESSETELSLLDIGADAFVTKTKDPRILCLHIKRLVELRRAA